MELTGEDMFNKRAEELDREIIANNKSSSYPTAENLIKSDPLEERTSKIQKWLSNKYNLTLIIILIISFVIRLYYFSITYQQPLWWDEAEYMNIARRWAGGLPFDFSPVRPVLFSFITSIIFRITESEFLPRVFILIMSLISLVGMYYLGKEIYNKKVGLLATFLMSLFYLNLFFTSRLIVDIPSLTFFIFSALLFYKYFKDNKDTKSLYLGSALIAIGTMFKQSTGFFLAVVLLYLIFTTRFKFLLRKELYISAIIFLAVISPYIIWGYAEFGGFVLTEGPAEVLHESPILRGIQGIKDYSLTFPEYIFAVTYNPSNSFFWFSTGMLILALLIWYSLKLIIGFDQLGKREDINKIFYLLLVLIIPIVLAALLINHNENRYIINSFSSMFIILSVVVLGLYSMIKKSNKNMALVFLIAFLLFFSYSQIQHSNDLIINRVSSYQGIKDAGLWINVNSDPEDEIVSRSAYQLQWYSNRKSHHVGGSFTIEQIDQIFQENPNIKYYVVSVYEKTPEYMYQYPQNKNMIPAKAFFTDPQQTQPLLIIYEITNDVNSEENQLNNSIIPETNDINNTIS